MLRCSCSLFLIVILFVQMLLSCTPSGETPQSELHANFGGMYAVYNNRLYTAGTSGFKIREYKIDPIFSGSSEYCEFICTDALCKHNTGACPGVLWGSGSTNLIADTSGDNVMPILYASYTSGLMPQDGGGGEIVRIDLNTNQKTTIVSDLSSAPSQIALYGDSLYIVTAVKTDDDSCYELSIIPKDGGDPYTYRPKDNADLYLIDIVNGTVYFSDHNGKIYTADKELKNVKLLYTLPELMTSTNDKAADFCVRINNGYLYFRKNYRPTGYSDHYASDYYRLPLSDLGQDAELVCKNLLTTHLYGFNGDTLYYAKAEFQDGYKVVNSHTNLEESRVTETGGNVYAYDLASKTESKVIPDCGVDFYWSDFLLTDHYFIDMSCSTYKQDVQGGYYILDIDSGELKRFIVPDSGFGY